MIRACRNSEGMNNGRLWRAGLPALFIAHAATAAWDAGARFLSRTQAEPESVPAACGKGFPQGKARERILAPASACSSWRAGMAALLIACAATSAFATKDDLGNGFLHHGVATPVSNHRGTVATVDGEGRNIVLVWLFDHRGGYALLWIDAETGKSEEFAMPFPPGGDCPYSSILSSRNKFYTHSTVTSPSSTLRSARSRSSTPPFRRWRWA